jgi:hypothetical protein
VCTRAYLQICELVAVDFLFYMGFFVAFWLDADQRDWISKLRLVYYWINLSPFQICYKNKEREKKEK